MLFDQNLLISLVKMFIVDNKFILQICVFLLIGYYYVIKRNYSLFGAFSENRGYNVL